MKIYYLYPTPRIKILKQVENNKAPDTLLYGANHLAKMSHQIIFNDQNSIGVMILYWLFLPLDYLFYKSIGLGFKLNLIIPQIIKINKTDAVITTVDSVGLPTLFLKLTGLIRVPIIYISTDLINRINEKNVIKLKVLKYLFSKCEFVVCHSIQEKKDFIQKLNFRKNRVYFIPAGGDPDFFKPSGKIRSKYILFVGRDRSRDTDKIVELAKILNNVKFVMILSKKLFFKVPNLPNIKKYSELSFLRLKHLYITAQALVLPLYELNKAEAQLVVLDSLLMKLPVIVSPVTGIKDTYGLINNRELTYATTIKSFSDKTRIILKNRKNVNKMVELGRKKVLNNFTTKHYADKLNNILMSLTG